MRTGDYIVTYSYGGLITVDSRYMNLRKKYVRPRSQKHNSTKYMIFLMWNFPKQAKLSYGVNNQSNVFSRVVDWLV